VGDSSLSSSTSTTTLEGSCLPNWQCSEWRRCDGGFQRRTCTDFNDCRTNLNKPEEARDCDSEEVTILIEFPDSSGTSGCVPNFNCNEWDKCNAVYNLKNLIDQKILLKGKQERLCQDKNRCSPNKIERQECETKIPVTAEKIKKCFKDYIEIRDLKNKLISRLELVNGTYEKLNIQLLFDNEYCPYCYDNIKNYDEDEKDCVYTTDGSCMQCAEHPLKQDYNFQIIVLITILIIIIIEIIILLNLFKPKRRERQKRRRRK
jgi:hypothetical protein